MANYAVIRIKGRQYKVSEGDDLLIDKQQDGKVEPEVLLLVKEDKVSIGKPKVAGATVKLKVAKEIEKGEKIEVLKYRAKSRYRKRTGFRPLFTRVTVEKIT